MIEPQLDRDGAERAAVRSTLLCQLFPGRAHALMCGPSTTLGGPQPVLEPIALDVHFVSPSPAALSG